MDRVLEFGLAASRGLALRAQPARFGVFSEGGYIRYMVWSCSYIKKCRFSCLLSFHFLMTPRLDLFKCGYSHDGIF
jgi:hypothetical protein